MVTVARPNSTLNALTPVPFTLVDTTSVKVNKDEINSKQTFHSDVL